MKKILGLDIGTNSIGWAFIESNAYESPEVLSGKIIELGSRIIPMDASAINDFETGISISKAAARRQARSSRRLNQRYKLRRTRLIEALKILDWIPVTFPTDFKRLNGKHSISKYLPFTNELREDAVKYFEIDNKKTTKGNQFQISDDWLIYFLKTKALKEKISLPELARILYHYNQRRGFKSSRKDNKIQEETEELTYPLKEKWVETVTVTSIVELGKSDGRDIGKTIYELTCKTSSLEFKTLLKRKYPIDWLNKTIETEITKTTTKNEQPTYDIKKVDPNAWENRKFSLEKEISKANIYISEFYLNKIKSALQQNEYYTIKQRVVDRSFYQKEFEEIWKVQSKFYQDEFTDKNKIAEIADTFYTYNKEKSKELKNKGLFHIFFNDIIYYQRGLKSQKSLIANCNYETKAYKTKDGEIRLAGVKVASKSAPCFQEFRIWQVIHNLKVFQIEGILNGKLSQNIDSSDIYLTPDNKEKLFELFNNLSEISHENILKLLGVKKNRIENGKNVYDCKLNFHDDKPFIGNETKSLFRKVFKKYNYIEAGEKIINDKRLLNHLWHIVYSLPEEKELISALSNKKYFEFPDDLIKSLSKLPEFPSQYASLSSKAINKLLPLMRIGKYWSETEINEQLTRSEKFKDFDSLLTDNSIPDPLRKEIKKRNLKDIYDLSGLPTFIATYIIYGRHSERVNEEKYEKPDDFKIKEIIPHNSLRNPVVEKVIREALCLVKDIWANDNLGRPDYIHVELGREMKNTKEDRIKIGDANSKNRIERERVSNLLKELKYPDYKENSPTDIDKFKIWKENGGKQGEENFDLLFKKNNAEFVKGADIDKYRHWAEQNYRSPYTGNSIPLSKLFTEEYQIDHIIPRAKFYDDSFGNKVVVEAEVNALKSNRLAIQFIEESQGQKISLTNGKIVQVLSLEDYKKFIEDTFTNRKKKRHLKLFEVPEDFIERQMNDTKYISRTVAQFLRPIAIGTDSDEGVVYTSGAITSDLKNKWGLNKLWKEILKPRFERLEEILGEQLILSNETKKSDYHFAKEYKRIDHRHHALDALVVACTSRSHIKYLNSLNSLSNNKKDIAKYGEWAKWKYLLNKKKQLENQENGMTEFSTPWENFYFDTKNAIESVIVSHKPTAKLISKPINKYYKWKEVESGKWEKKIHFQEPPTGEDKYWVAVRQSLFGQPLGKIYLAEYKKDLDIKAALKHQIRFLNRKEQKWNTEDWRIAKSDLRKQFDRLIKEYDQNENKILKFISSNPFIDQNGNTITKIDLLQFKKYASKRVDIDESFTKDKIEKIPYSHLESNWLTNLLKNHLEEYKDPKIAFKGEALEMLYKKAPHIINKVTRKESGNKIELNNKLLDGDKGVNQYFIIEIKKEINKKTGIEETIRKYTTPNFLECIERLAKGLPIHDEAPNSKYIVLSPGDLVYVPEEGVSNNQINWDDKKAIAQRIYIMKSSQESLAYFLPANISTLLHPYDTKTKKGEFESMNKSEKTIDKKQTIKENFIKLKVDRLGIIKPLL